MCLGGCYRDSKQSVGVTFIPEARKNGLEVWTDFFVDKLDHNDDSVKITGKKNSEVKEIIAKKCVLAGGSLGTTQLLFKSKFKEALPSLGEKFYCHPQIMNFAVFDEQINAHKGAFQTVKSDDIHMREKGYKLENVFASPIGIAMLYPEIGKKHQEWMRKYQYLMCMEVAVRDIGKGRLDVDKKGKLVIRKQLSKEDHKRAKEGMKTVKEIFEVLNAKEIYQSPLMFGLHLMGGCAIGVDPQTSVVNENYQVHNYPNLYIADSSIFPNAPGINPALTIMALSHKASQKAIEIEKSTN
ncbi:MAG: GMC oxidoreductase [Candidatus Hodarchaeales archaeon]